MYYSVKQLHTGIVLKCDNLEQVSSILHVCHRIKYIFTWFWTERIKTWPKPQLIIHHQHYYDWKMFVLKCNQEQYTKQTGSGAGSWSRTE